MADGISGEDTDQEHSADEDAHRRRQFYGHMCIRGAGPLQRALACDEAGYLQAAGYCHRDARAFFLYGILDEVIKSGSAIQRWSGLLTGPIPEDRTDDDRHVTRLVIESIIDEQCMWIRKLVEALIDVICFGDTNEQGSYRAYLAAKELDALLSRQKDFETFLGGRSAALQSSILEVACLLAREGMHARGELAWFVKSLPTEDRLPKPGQVLQPVRTRFRRALRMANRDEQLTLCASYEDSYGRASRMVHCGVGAEHWRSTCAFLDGQIGHVAILCADIIMRAYGLAGIEPSGTAAQLKRFFETGSEGPRILESMHRREFDVGDIVIAAGQLAEVVERVESDYGYVSYAVRYLLDQPRPGVVEDWLPGRYIQRLFKLSEAKQFLTDGLERMGERDEVVELIRSVSHGEASAAVKQAIVELWKLGLLQKAMAASRRPK